MEQTQSTGLQIAAPSSPKTPAAGTKDVLSLREPAPPVPMTGLRKAAVLLITIGEVASAEIIKGLGDEEVQRISRVIATTEPISSQQALEVLREFQQLAAARSYVVKGGLEYAQKMLRNAFGVEAARRLLDRVTQSIGEDMANFDALQKAEPQQLANFVHEEHPQTIALMLSHLNPSQAAAVLTALPAAVRGNVVKRMAKLSEISPEIISRIALVIGEKLKSLGDVKRQPYGGVGAVAELLNRLDGRLRNDVLNEIESGDTELAETIRQLMFVFEDLLGVDSAGIRELLNVVDRNVLTVALKGTSEALQNHFMQNMSMAGAEMLREDIEVLGPVKIRDVEAAQQKIIALVRDLESKGRLSLSPNDQYVV
jgi:flagellar motor switch protein FliG